jgi:bifunctional polynucleotide phosphatase/kinase
MDDTLITRKSGAKFPKDADDWLILYPQVGPTLQKLVKDGYKLVIFTNQNGIEKGHTNPEHIKKKVANIAK